MPIAVFNATTSNANQSTAAAYVPPPNACLTPTEYPAWIAAWTYGLLVPISTVGTIGNLNVIVAYVKTPALHIRQNVYILALALADLVICAFVLPLYVVMFWSGCWPFGLSLCRAWTIANTTSFHVGLHVIVLVGADRLVPNAPKAYAYVFFLIEHV